MNLRTPAAASSVAATLATRTPPVFVPGPHQTAEGFGEASGFVPITLAAP